MRWNYEYHISWLPHNGNNQIPGLFQDFSRTYYPFSGTFFQIFSNIIAIEFKCLEKYDSKINAQLK